MALQQACETISWRFYLFGSERTNEKSFLTSWTKLEPKYIRHMSFLTKTGDLQNNWSTSCLWHTSAKVSFWTLERSWEMELVTKTCFSEQCKTFSHPSVGELTKCFFKARWPKLKCKPCLKTSEREFLLHLYVEQQTHFYVLSGSSANHRSRFAPRSRSRARFSLPSTCS